METIQRQLSEYLQCELYHLLGAYGAAEKHLHGLSMRLSWEAGEDYGSFRSSEKGAGTGAEVLAELVRLSGKFNHALSRHRYASDPLSRTNPSLTHSADPKSWPVREPMPTGLPMTNIKRFAVGPKDDSMSTNRQSPWSSDRDWEAIPRFYNEAIAALLVHRDLIGNKEADEYDELCDGRSGEEARDRANQRNFARALLAPRDGASARRKPRAELEHLERRVDRYQQRLTTAVRTIGADREGDDGQAVLSRLGDPAGKRKGKRQDFLDLLINNQPGEGEESFSVFVLRVQAEAHLSMHAVEAWRAMCIGEHAKALRGKENEWLERELERSIALSTFAYCASRTAPWIFARSEEERKAVIRDVSGAWENVVPVRCMWIASQISLLSLHRRAYARALQRDRSAEAYNDYHKLQHLIRDTERRVDESPLHISGARGFLAGLNAEAHHHIGELYRAEHAHKQALEHFEAASHRLELLRKDDRTFDEVLTNSRWYVELQISRGKACYEMGRHKEALYWHLRAWRAFLELLSSETTTETNTKYIVEAIDWLESVKFEPELRKSEIYERIGPVVEQLDRITAVGRVGSLAAEILLRLGHLLFVLNIGYFDPKKLLDTSKPRPADEEGPERSPEELREEQRTREREARARIRGTLAYSCLIKARECDPYSTLIGADLMKTRFRFNTWWDEKLPEAYSVGLSTGSDKPINQHWPRGGSDYERLARIAEYLMLKSRRARFEVGPGDEGAGGTDGLLARDLLLDLFMSTDSINVRKSQIHRFLMKGEVSPGLPQGEGAPAIEFVCMRRYSSPFPLLPRPSAFRALGGGYFVRLHSAEWKDGRPRRSFGIVVDPGVDFVENLYRADFSLGDIDMVVITHDHVDHLGALDPLLSLLHVRSQILVKQRRAGDEPAPAHKVTVLTSQSVYNRYMEVSQLSPSSRNFEFESFEQVLDGESRVVLDPKRFDFPEEFEIVTMSSTAGSDPRVRKNDRDGHRDLSCKPSHGVCFRRRGASTPSVAITSDTPPPPPDTETERLREWEGTWEPAFLADILVVHLGSVPLTELRRMDHTKRKELDREERHELKRDEKALRKLRRKLEKANKSLKGQIEYAQWLRSHDPDRDSGKPDEDSGDPDEDKYMAEIVGSVPDEWLPPPEHNFLAGLLRWARAYERRWADTEVAGEAGSERAKPQGLFVVGELSEELGTMRGKVATRLNRRVFMTHDHRKERDRACASGSTGFPYALTADIGLRACVYPHAEDGGTRVAVLCTTCNLDTDRTPRESYHACHDVYEVCVKGENEGIFYNCLEHDPARQDEPAFLEKLERFDIFGR